MKAKSTKVAKIEMGNILYAYGELQDNGKYRLLDYFNTDKKARNAAKKAEENMKRAGQDRKFAAFMFDLQICSWVELKPERRFAVSMKVDGRMCVEVMAGNAAEAFEKAMEKWESVDFDFNKMEIVDSAPVNAEDDEGNLIDYE
jgi:hypothetical protein